MPILIYRSLIKFYLDHRAMKQKSNFITEYSENVFEGVTNVQKLKSMPKLLRLFLIIDVRMQRKMISRRCVFTGMMIGIIFQLLLLIKLF